LRATPFQGDATFAFAAVGIFAASIFFENFADATMRRLMAPGFAGIN
jgi:hypothetical protein